MALSSSITITDSYKIKAPLGVWGKTQQFIVLITYHQNFIYPVTVFCKLDTLIVKYQKLNR
jgi:hypothetical protein